MPFPHSLTAHDLGLNSLLPGPFAHPVTPSLCRPLSFTLARFILFLLVIYLKVMPAPSLSRLRRVRAAEPSCLAQLSTSKLGADHNSHKQQPWGSSSKLKAGVISSTALPCVSQGSIHPHWPWASQVFPKLNSGKMVLKSLIPTWLTKTLLTAAQIYTGETFPCWICYGRTELSQLTVSQDVSLRQKLLAQEILTETNFFSFDPIASQVFW